MFLDQVRALATDLPRRFVRRRRYADFAPDLRFTLTDAHEHAHQFARIEPVRFRASRAATHLDARRVDDAIRDPERRQRAMNPKPITAGFIHAHDRRGRRQLPPVPPVGDRSRNRAQIARRHGPQPRLDANPRRHGQLPIFRTQLKRDVQRRFTYTTELRADRCSHDSLLRLGGLRKLNCSGPLS